MNEDLSIQIEAMSYAGFKSGVNVIENLQFKVPAGHFVSILGPSGAGKTTLLRIIAGLEQKYKGTVLLGDKAINKPTIDIQMVFQNNCLLPWKTVEENIHFALGRNSFSQHEKKTLVGRWIDKVRLVGKEKRWPKTLSGGEQGRVAFARTFVNRPKVLLLDEPFRNVDIEIRYDLHQKLLETLQEHPASVLFVSHNIEDAVLLSDVVYLFIGAPLRVQKVYQVNIDKPRRPDQPSVIEFISKITRDILGYEPKD